MGIAPRLVPSVLVALLGLLALWPVAGAAAPGGPRLAVQVSRPYPDLSAIETVGPNGEDSQLLVGGAGDGAIRPNLSRPAWSPDGGLLAFTSSRGEYSPVPYLVSAEGGRPHLVSKTTPISEPIFTPDGRWLTFLALRVVKGHFERPQIRARDEYGVVVDWAIWRMSLNGKRFRKVTGWKRRRQLTPTSYSPDGRYLAAERYDGRGEDAVVIDLKSRKVRVVARDAEEPVFSPDGTRIAYVRTRNRPPSEPEGNRPPGSSALLVVPANLRGEPKRIARIKGGLAWPSWDPSSSRIAFTRLDGGDPFLGSIPAEGNSVMQVNADGTCLDTLLAIEGRGHYEGVAWQPGPGRGAGPIAC
jgi:Tol biopolymer transport system component